MSKPYLLTGIVLIIYCLCLKAQTISQLEYFFDTDPGVGNGTLVLVTSPKDSISQPLDIDISTLSSGFHHLYVRSIADDGEYSIQKETRFFIAQPIIQEIKTRIIELEYFFDTDPGVGNGIKIPVTTPLDSIDYKGIQISVDGLTTGFHALYIRSKDETNEWSLQKRAPFAFLESPVFSDSKLVRVEYFFGKDPGFGNGYIINLETPQDSIDMVLQMNLENCEVGEDTLYVRVIDNWNVPSFYMPAEFSVDSCKDVIYSLKDTICEGDSLVFGSQILKEPGIYSEVMLSNCDCDSIVEIELIVKPINYSVSATICEGETYTLGSQNLTTEGTFTETFISSLGCDSIVELNLSITEIITTEISESICQGTDYNFGDTIISSAGTFMESYTSVGGCDSIVTLNLVVNPSYKILMDTAICEGESLLFNGNQLTESGIYIDTLNTIDGCDSIVTFNLIVNSTQTTNIEKTLCAGDSILFGTEFLKNSGSYTFTEIDIFGCDSIINLDLTILSPISIIVDSLICQNNSIEFGTQIINASGTYFETFSSVFGCDSLVQLNVEIAELYNIEVYDTICTGDVYNFDGQILSETGIYPKTLVSSSGCDSIVSLNLWVLERSFLTIDTTICFGKEIVFGSLTIDQSGKYEQSFEAFNGCDSIVTLKVEILPEISTSITASICEGDSLLFNNQHLNKTGVYTAIFNSSTGCDSTVTLDLVVESTINSEQSITICQGETYTFGDQQITTSGFYEEVFASTAGCDSIVSLEVIFVDTLKTSIRAEICEGDVYMLGPQVLDKSGEYTHLFNSQFGCDSIVKLELTVNPLQTTQFLDTICFGETYTFGLQTLYETGKYTEIFSGSNGCDSIVELALHVHEQELNVVLNDTLLELATLPNNASFQWIDCSNEDGEIQGATSPTFVPETAGNYAVKVTQDRCTFISNCIYFDPNSVELIELFDAITPNNDGYNDEWIIKGIEDYPEAEVIIFDRRGVKIFESKGAYTPWTGYYDGSLLPMGSYFYVIILTKGSKAIKGDVSIIY